MNNVMINATEAIRLMPGTPIPELVVETLAGIHWNIHTQAPENFTMIVFYRGLHCPLCAEYLQAVESLLDQFRDIGVNAIAISGDSVEKALKSQKEWGLEKLTIGYGLTLEVMQQWGLYVSKGELQDEPPFFNEPGTFLVNRDNILFFAGVNNAPYGRVDLSDLLSGLKYALVNNSPLRGTE